MTAIVEVTRNSSKAARGLNSIFSRLTQVLDEESSTGKALIEIYDELGISLYDLSTGQMRSTFDILSDLSKQWDTLSTNQQRNIALQSSGANQLNNFLALMKNFGTAIDATSTAMDSAGSAAEENARQMESLGAKTNAVKQSFQELANSIIDNELVGMLLDIGKALLDIANTDAGKFIIVATAITALTVAVKGLLAAIKLSKALMATFVGSTASAGVAAGALAGGPLALLIAGFSLLITFAPQIIDFFDSIANPIEHFTEKLADTNQQLQANRDRLAELSKIPWYDRTSEIQKEIDELKKLNEELVKERELRREELATGYETDFSKTFKEETEQVEYYVKAWDKTYDTVEELLDALSFSKKGVGQLGSLEEAEKAGLRFEERYKTLTLSSEEYYSKAVARQKELNEQVEQGVVLSNRDAAERQKLNDELTTFAVRVKDAASVNADLGSALYKVGEEAGEVVTQFEEQNKALGIMPNAFKITQEAAESLISENGNLATSIGSLNGEYYIEQETLINLARAGNTVAQQMIKYQKELTNVAITEIGKRIAGFEKELEAYNSLTESEFAHLSPVEKDQYRGILRTIEENKKLIAIKKQEVENIQSEIDSWVPPTTTPPGTTKEEDPVKKQMALDKEEIAQMEHKLFLTKQIAGSEKDQIALMKAIQDKLHEQAEWYRTNAPEETAFLRELSKQWFQYGEDIESVYEAMKNKAQEAMESVISSTEHDIFLLTQQDSLGNAEAIVSKYKDMQELVHERAEQLRLEDAEGNKELIAELQRMWWGYHDEIIRVYASLAQNRMEQAKEEMEAAQKEADAYKLYAKMMIDTIQEEIDGYQKEITALEDANKEREKEIDLEEKLEALAKAKAQKVMVYKDGEYQYIEDIDAVSEAQSDLDKFKREQDLDEEKKKWQKKIAMAEEYKKEWQNFTKDYEKNANKQELIQSGLFKKEDLLFDKRITGVQNFASKYEDAMNRATAALNRMEQAQKDMDKLSSSIGGGGGGGGGGGTIVTSGGKTIEDYKKDYQDAKDRGDAAGMAAANEGANAIRDQTGQKREEATEDIANVAAKKKHANGTLSAPGGLSLVGEKGPELRVLNPGDGIIPTDVTKNILAWGSTTPANMMSALSGLGATASKSMEVVIQNLNLPSVKDGNGFVEYMKNNFWRSTVQTASI